MSNRLGAALTAGIIGLGALGVWCAPLASADVISDDSPAFDCRFMGNHICGPGNDQGVKPGWYGDMDCWPGAVYCPDIDGPYDATKVHPGMWKMHTFDDDGNDLGPGWDDGIGHVARVYGLGA